MFIIEFSNTNITNWVTNQMGPLAIEHLPFTVSGSSRTSDLDFDTIVMDIQFELVLLAPPAQESIEPIPTPEYPFFPDTPYQAALFAANNLQFQIYDRHGTLLHDCSPFGVLSFEVMPLETLNNYSLDKLFRYHLRAQTFASSVLRKVQAHLSDSLSSSLDTIAWAHQFLSGWLTTSLVSTMESDPPEVYRLIEVLQSVQSLHSSLSKDFSDFSFSSDPFDLEFC